MKIITRNDILQIKTEIATTVGFFDGVHAGHRFLLEQLKSLADARKLPSSVITFPQHPQSTLRTGFKPDLLNTLDEKIDRLSLSGMDYCLLLDFTKSLAQLSAEEFIQDYLQKKLHVKLLLIGYDHRLGRNRAEDFEKYVKYGEACGMEVVRALELPDRLVSSTLIRTHLLEKNPREANRMLSYFYSLGGEVIEGNRLGRKIGFPTANLNVTNEHKVLPGEGIYAVWVSVGQKRYGGMAYIGKRPTLFAQGEKRIEVHLFDFSGNLYGKIIHLKFVEFLRNDKQFENTEELKKQLFIDKEMAIAALT